MAIRCWYLWCGWLLAMGKTQRRLCKRFGPMVGHKQPSSDRAYLRWHHVFLVHGWCAWNYDSVSATAVDSGFNLSTLTDIGINGGSPFSDSALTGSTWDLRMYSGASTADQVASVYALGSMRAMQASRRRFPSQAQSRYWWRAYSACYSERLWEKIDKYRIIPAK